jgi:hypothetical protein
MQMRMTCKQVACGESRSRASGRQAVSPEGGQASRVEPTPPGSDPTGSEGSAVRRGLCLGFRADVPVHST